MVAADPMALAGLLESVAGRPAERAEGGLKCETGRGVLRALTPAAFSRRYAGAPAPSLARGPRFAGCRIRTADLAALRSRLSEGKIAFAEADGALALSDDVLLVSGRLSFELVQKAAMAGIPALCEVSAPSNLAVAAAERFGQTVIGFVRDGRFNVYAHPERVEA